MNSSSDPNKHDFNANRNCTDKCCCFIFLLFTILSMLIAWVALLTGDPSILATPHDMNHHPCGIHENAGYPYIYFPTPKSISTNVCVDRCPNKDTKSINCLNNDICKSGSLAQNVTGGIMIYETLPGDNFLVTPLNFQQSIIS